MFVKEKANQLVSEIENVVIGQKDLVRHLIVAFLTEGHVLLEGVPGLGKTLLAKALAKTIEANYKRVQFTPDLMPTDILGTKVFNLKDSEFYLKKGPVFTNILLADEINRTPPKTQSALLEAMEEGQVTIDGETLTLSKPFFVMATQNPVEYEGTYPLPEAQLDRFLMKLNIDYFDQKDENLLLSKYRDDFKGSHDQVERLLAVINNDDIEKCRKEIASVTCEEGIINYITSITNATRKSNAIMLGSSPRGSIAILLCAKTVAAMAGRDYVIPEDVVDIVYPVLAHRLILRPEAEIDGLNAYTVLKNIVEKIDIPR